MKSLEDILSRWREKLLPIYDEAEAEQIIFLVMEEVLKLRRVDLSLRKKEVLSDSMQICLEAILRMLAEGVPVQYVMGFAWFDGLKIEVNKHVLIPRQETEELVNWIVKDVNATGRIGSILDICSGSGCIGLSLKNHFSDTSIYCLDISQEAIACAKRNSENLKLPLEFILADVLALTDLPVSTDIIVSNPPYVMQSESAKMHNRVLNHEPHLALFVPNDDALKFYQKIAILSYDKLSENGRLYFEINESLGEEVVALLTGIGFRDIQLRRDLNGKFRMIKAVK